MGFEDGQGLGQIIGACAPVYDKSESESTGVSIMFGVICVSIHKDTWEGYSDHALVMTQIEEADKQCPKTSLSEEQMEVVRGRMYLAKSCVVSDGEAASAMVGAVVGALVGLALVGMGLRMGCKKKVGPGTKPRSAEKPPAPQQVQPTAQRAQPVYMAQAQPQPVMGVHPAQVVAQGQVIAPPPAYHIGV